MHAQISSVNFSRSTAQGRFFQLVALCALALCSVAHAQPQRAAASAVPRLLNFSGTATDAQGKALPGVTGVTFAIYKEREGGAPLWLETQSVTADSKGHFNAQLGSTRGHGVPTELFNTTDSLWLGVTVSGQEEQPRVLLLSVPYALKAADAETLGGLPASAFMLSAAPASASANTASQTGSTGVSPALSGTGTANYVPLWTDSSGTLGNSAIFQSGTSPTAKIGVNISSPTAALEVQGTETVHGQFTMPSAGLATASSGKKSYPLDMRAASYNSSTKASVFQNFLWEAEPSANNSANPSGTLNLLFAAGSASPAETGLKIASNGQITFAPAQTFPGSGTVTSVGLSAPSSDFTVSGSPVTKSGTLGLNWTIAPTSQATPNAIVKRDTNGLISTQGVISNNSNGVGLVANSPGNAGILGGSSTNVGVEGTSLSGHGLYGLTGQVNVAIGAAYAVYGHNLGVNGVGVHGDTSGNTGIGVSGFAEIGVEGDSASIDGSGAGVVAVGRAGSAGLYATTGAGGPAVNANNSSSGTGILANSFGGDAGFFNGDVQIDGNLSKDGGSFKIDHPLDPANKYLYHSFVESPDMMNIYNGNVTTNSWGEAVVTLPEWFEILNRDFRYQLTVMGQFAQAIVASKVADHKFTIKTDKPNVEVSWQITGIRHDAWANAHRIPVEEEKSAKERGFYKHPDLYGAPEEKSILWAREPNAMKQWKESKIRAAQEKQGVPPVR